jgi:hypothetical protein
MVVPHVVIMISPKNKPMQLHAEMLIRSIVQLGHCKKLHISLVIPEMQIPDLNNNFLLSDKIDIVSYRPAYGASRSWNHSPRWFVEPKSELYLAIDSDAIVCKDINPLLQICMNNNSLSAVEAVSCPFNKHSLETWESIYRTAGIALPDTLYMYRDFNHNIWNNYETDSVGPFYPNCGVVALPSIYLAEMQRAVKVATNVVCEIVPNNPFIPQIVVSLAASLSQIPITPLDTKYNCLEIFDRFNKDVVIYHYNITRDSIVNKKDMRSTHNNVLKRIFSSINLNNKSELNYFGVSNL